MKEMIRNNNVSSNQQLSLIQFHSLHLSVKFQFFEYNDERYHLGVCNHLIGNNLTYEVSLYRHEMK